MKKVMKKFIAISILMVLLIIPLVQLAIPSVQNESKALEYIPNTNEANLVTYDNEDVYKKYTISRDDYIVTETATYHQYEAVYSGNFDFTVPERAKYSFHKGKTYIATAVGNSSKIAYFTIDSYTEKDLGHGRYEVKGTMSCVYRYDSTYRAEASKTAPTFKVAYDYKNFATFAPGYRSYSTMKCHTKTYIGGNKSNKTKIEQKIVDDVQEAVNNVQQDVPNSNNTYVPVTQVQTQTEYDLPSDAKRLFVKTLYRRCLKREPRNDEYEMFTNRFNVREVAYNVILSPESGEKNKINSLSNEEYIKCLYRFLLGREAEEKGLKEHTELLNKSNDRAVAAIRNFTNSSEFDRLRNKTTQRITLDESLTNAVYNSLSNQNFEVTKLDNTTLIMFESDVSNVKTLNISGSGVKNLNGLSTFTNLESLSAQSNNLENISELEKMSNLKYLNLNNNNLNSNIAPVWKLTNLEQLYIDGTGITNNEFSGVAGLSKLVKLSVNNNSLTHLNDVKGISTLKELYANGNTISSTDGVNVEKISVKNQADVSGKNKMKEITFYDKALADRLENRLGDFVKARINENGKYTLTMSTGRIKTIENLDLSLTEGDTAEITDIRGLENFINLKSLNLTNNKVTNLDVLKDLHSLNTLIIRGNNLTNLNGLAKVTSLKQLDASSNLIDNINGLSELKQLNTVLLNNNKIGNNLSPLKNLSANLSILAIDNNNVSSLQGLENVELNALYASYNQISNLEGLNENYLSTLKLRNNNTTIYMEESEIVLPDIVKRVIEKEGIAGVECTNCTIIDNYKVKLNEGCMSAQIKLKDIKENERNGFAGDTIINLKNPKFVTAPVIGVIYKDVEGGVKVTLKSDKPIYSLYDWDREDDTFTKFSKVYNYNVSNQKVVLSSYGNKTEAIINISSIQNENIPGLKVAYSETAPTKDSVTVTISADVRLADPITAGWTLSADRKSMSCTFTENDHYGKAVSQESGAGSTSVLVNVSNIDKTAPTCNVEYSETEKTNRAVVATIWATEDIDLTEDNAKLFDKRVSRNNRGQTIYGLALLYNDNANETLTVKDNAGNTKQVNISINNIDNKLEGLNATTSGIEATSQDQVIKVKASEKIELLNNAKTVIATVKKQIDDEALYKVAATKPFAVLAEGEEQSSNDENTLTINVQEGNIGTLEVEDEAGNTDLTVYDTTHIDKTAPEVTTSECMNSDGTKTVSIVANEKIKDSEDLAGWTLSEDQLILSKVFKSNRNEKVVIRDLADNETTVNIEVTGVLAIGYELEYELIDGTDYVLITIKTENEILEPEGWTLLEDKKSISKALRVDQSEKVLIENSDGYGSEINLKSYNELMTLKEQTEDNQNEQQKDDTTAKVTIPQTGKYVAFVLIISSVLIIITTLVIMNSEGKKYKKNNKKIKK